MALLRSDRIDPDMLDERARALLGYADPRDLILLLTRASNPVRRAGVIHRRLEIARHQVLDAICASRAGAPRASARG